MKRDDVTGEGGSCTVRSFIICILPQISLDRSNQGELSWARHVTCVGEARKVYKVLVGKPERKKPLGRLTRGWDQTGSQGDWLRACEVDSVGSG
jgi:hypothetical protein